MVFFSHSFFLDWIALVAFPVPHTAESSRSIYYVDLLLHICVLDCSRCRMVICYRHPQAETLDQVGIWRELHVLNER